ncbi:MAG: MFS transporter [SAR202 cluster bacterium]|nr:hypothetical protein [Chloroflexota bacterium]MQG69187.1 MFS transporter [SAR202 cluster bacterium]HAL49260.1 hypothetical protein [Dehalococcoidia bacterium]
MQPDEHDHIELPDRARQPYPGNRGLVLGNMSMAHGVSHSADQGFPVLMPTISTALGLSDFQVSVLWAFRFAGFGIVNLGGGLAVDMLKRHWGVMLTGCMLMAGLMFALTGAVPNYEILIVVVFLGSIPGALWHLPSSASLSQIFPDRRGFALSIHGFGANVGNVLGPVIATAMLGLLGSWRRVFFSYAAPLLLVGVVVWLTLRNVGRFGVQERRALRTQLRDVSALIKKPVVIMLVLAATLRGIGLDAVFAWSPFYLEETLGKGHLSAGIHYSLLSGMGIVSAPILGTLSDRFGRKAVLAPGFALASALALLVGVAGDGAFLVLVFAGMGLFSFALHQVIQAAVLDVAGEGTEATAVGLIFGLNGILGVASPFLAFLVIDNLGGYGSVYCYAGGLTVVAMALVLLAPMNHERANVPSRKLVA